MTLPEITLRYFAIRGRAQPIREFLLDSHIAFVDEQVPLSWQAHGWQTMREQPELGGPYKALPVLHWGEAQLAETSAIVAFLTRSLAPTAGLDALALSRHDAVFSCAFRDVGYIAAEAIWADLAFPGCRCETFIRVHGPRLLQKLASLDAQYPQGRFLGGQRPALADYFAAQALDNLAHILPPGQAGKALADRFPGLSSLARSLAERARERDPNHTQPDRLTGCPSELESVARLREVDWLPARV